LKAAAAREIALAFGVPPMLLGLPGDATYANYREANRALWRLTVLPLADRLLGAIGAALGAWMVAVALVSLGLPVATLVVWRRRAALSAGHGSGRRRGKGGHGDGRGSGVALVSSSAVSPAATVAPSPSATEPAAAAVVTAPVVPAVLAAAVAVATEEAVVARAGPRPGPAPPPAAITAAADKVCYDAKDYAYRDHEQDNQKQFHGTTLPVDARDARSYLTRMRPFVTTLSFLRAPARGSYTRPQTY